MEEHLKLVFNPGKISRFFSMSQFSIKNHTLSEYLTQMSDPEINLKVNIIWNGNPNIWYNNDAFAGTSSATKNV